MRKPKDILVVFFFLCVKLPQISSDSITFLGTKYTVHTNIMFLSFQKSSCFGSPKVFRCFFLPHLNFLQKKCMNPWYFCPRIQVHHHATRHVLPRTRLRKEPQGVHRVQPPKQPPENHQPDCLRRLQFFLTAQAPGATIKKRWERNPTIMSLNFSAPWVEENVSSEKVGKRNLWTWSPNDLYFWRSIPQNKA